MPFCSYLRRGALLAAFTVLVAVCCAGCGSQDKPPANYYTGPMEGKGGAGGGSRGGAPATPQPGSPSR